MAAFESLSNLLDYSVPTILVLAGIALIVLPFFKDMAKGRTRWALLVGVCLLAGGIALVLLVEPSEQELIPVYVLPTPGNAVPSSPELAPSPTVVANSPTVISAAASQTLEEEQISTNSSDPSDPTQAFATVNPVSAQPATTHTPELVTSTIPVWGIEENGVRVDVSAAGVYEVSYLGDAYSAWPNEQAEGYRGWTTIVRIYVNRPVEWGLTDFGLIGPINEDAYLSPGGYYSDKTGAISSSTGDSRTLRLQAGDYLTLVPLDEKGRYFDNQGKVDVGITYIGQ